MAKVIGGIGAGLSGSIDQLSFYKMKGVDKTIVRRKGGHTREKIKTDPRLRLFGLANVEFGGRAKASQYLMRVLTHQKALADHNIAGPLNTLMAPVQKLDSAGNFGNRSVILSAHRHFLKGFSLNRQFPFDNVVRYPVSYSLDRETATAVVSFPELIPQINFFTQENYPYYGFCVSLGVVPDVHHTEAGYMPAHLDYMNLRPVHVETDWFPLVKGSPAMELTLKYEQALPDTHYTLVLAVGIRYGTVQGVDHIRQAPNAGSAKVLEVG